MSQAYPASDAAVVSSPSAAAADAPFVSPPSSKNTGFSRSQQAEVAEAKGASAAAAAGEEGLLEAEGASNLSSAKLEGASAGEDAVEPRLAALAEKKELEKSLNAQIEKIKETYNSINTAFKALKSAAPAAADTTATVTATTAAAAAATPVAETIKEFGTKVDAANVELTKAKGEL
jgi:hypothetical protein